MATLLVCKKLSKKYPAIKKDDYRKMKNPCQARVFTLLSIGNLVALPWVICYGRFTEKAGIKTHVSSRFINHSP